MSEINPEIDKKENTVTTDLNHMSGDNVVTGFHFGNQSDRTKLTETSEPDKVTGMEPMGPMSGDDIMVKGHGAEAEEREFKARMIPPEIKGTDLISKWLGGIQRGLGIEPKSKNAVVAPPKGPVGFSEQEAQVKK